MNGFFSLYPLMSAIDLANRPQFMLTCSSLETLSHDVMVSTPSIKRKDLVHQ
jgi:hypothetical protein